MKNKSNYKFQESDIPLDRYADFYYFITEQYDNRCKHFVICIQKN